MIDLEKTRDLARQLIGEVLKDSQEIRLKLQNEVLKFSDGQRYTDVVNADEYVDEVSAAQSIVVAIANGRMQRKLAQWATADDRRVMLYTVAPASYDGFSTVEVIPDAGRDNHDRVVRLVCLEPRDLDWQTGRYASGMHAYATPDEALNWPKIWRITLELTSDMPKPTLHEASHKLYELFRCGEGIHPYITSIGVAETTGIIHVYLVREPYHHERQIPSEWEGWPIETHVTGRMRLC